MRAAKISPASIYSFSEAVIRMRDCEFFRRPAELESRVELGIVEVLQNVKFLWFNGVNKLPSSLFLFTFNPAPNYFMHAPLSWPKSSSRRLKLEIRISKIRLSSKIKTATRSDFRCRVSFINKWRELSCRSSLNRSSAITKKAENLNQVPLQHQHAVLQDGKWCKVFAARWKKFSSASCCVFFFLSCSTKQIFRVVDLREFSHIWNRET